MASSVNFEFGKQFLMKLSGGKQQSDSTYLQSFECQAEPGDLAKDEVKSVFDRPKNYLRGNETTLKS